MKKYLICLFVVLLLVSCTACAAQEGAPAEEFVFSAESGYDFAPAPLGSSLQEVSDALNCTLVSKAESLGGVHDEDDDAYWTQEYDAVTVLGEKARVEVVFDEGALYDISFTVLMDDTDEGETLYRETVEAFKKSFGEPMTEKEGEDSSSALWRHENNTQLLIQLTLRDDQAFVTVGTANLSTLLE